MRKPKRIIVLRTRDGIDDALARLQHGPLAVDTETSGLDWTEDVVGAINLAAGTTSVVAIEQALAPVARWLGRQAIDQREMVFHNAKFDLHHLRRTFGLHISHLVHDTAVQSFLLDNRGGWAYGRWKDKPHALKTLASIFVDPDAQDPQKQLMQAIRQRAGVGSTLGDWAILMRTKDEHLVTDYSGYDPWYTLQLHLQFMERIRHWPQPPEKYPSLMSLYRMEQWMILALRDMEERGIQVRREFLETWRIELREKLKLARRKLWKLAGKREVNWNSPKQVGELLFSKLRLRGGPSTDAVSMLRLAHPIGVAIVQYRRLFKQESSYANSLLTAICDDGAVHTTIQSTGTDTGRTSCVDPNLQQQARDSGVRRAFVPRKGLVFRMADYSQIEMRYAAHSANEEWMIKEFNANPNFDAHTGTAIRMFGVDVPTGQQRDDGKTMNFTTLFGGGVGKVAEQLQERMELGDVMRALRYAKYWVKPGESPFYALADILKTRYNSAMPAVRRATRAESELAEHRGFVMNLFGRHRWIMNNRWHIAFNTKIQGTAGDKAKEGLVNVYRNEQLGRGSLALLLIVHDEIIYESDGDPRTDRRVLKLMEDRSLTRYKVKITADMKGSKLNWHDKEKIKL